MVTNEKCDWINNNDYNNDLASANRSSLVVGYATGNGNSVSRRLHYHHKYNTNPSAATANNNIKANGSNDIIIAAANKDKESDDNSGEQQHEDCKQILPYFHPSAMAKDKGSNACKRPSPFLNQENVRAGSIKSEGVKPGRKRSPNMFNKRSGGSCSKNYRSGDGQGTAVRSKRKVKAGMEIDPDRGRAQEK